MNGNQRVKWHLTKRGKIIITVGLMILLFCGTAAVGITQFCKAQGTSQDQTAAEPYGTRDGRKLCGEVSFDWAGNDEEAFVLPDCALPEEVQEFTFYLCQGYYIDYSFAMAVMFRESGFDAQAVSDDGHDHGLFQIRDVNNEWLQEQLGVTDMEDPYENIRSGIYILRGLFEKYDDPDKVLMAYRHGERGASILWGQGVMETTYSRNVLETADQFAAEIEKQTKK